ncbi:MAG: regulatory protein GemA, partial [Pseudomonadota bacterium]
AIYAGAHNRRCQSDRNFGERGNALADPRGVHQAMSITPNQIKLIWVAKRKIGMADDDFRAALVRLTGVASVKDLDGDGLDVLMGYFEYCGFRPRSPRGPNFGARPGMASFAQIELIRSLWHEYTGEVYANEDQLNAWMERYWKVSSLRFLTATDAPKLITALKAMKTRAA